MTFELMMNTLRLAGLEVHKEETDEFLTSVMFVEWKGKINC